MLAFLSKYWMPTSITWWTGIAMLLSGIVEDLSGSITVLAVLTVPLNAIWQGMPANALVAGGLTAIGLRSALATELATLFWHGDRRYPARAEMTALAVAAVALLAIVAVFVAVVAAARRNAATAAATDAQIKDMEHAAQVHKDAADARAVPIGGDVDQQLRDLGRLRD